MYSRTVTEYLNQTVEKYPDKIAVQDSKRSLSFREVQKEAIRIKILILSHENVENRRNTKTLESLL